MLQTTVWTCFLIPDLAESRVLEVGQDKIKAVNYDTLIAVLIESIKELKHQEDQQIQELTQEIKALEAKIDPIWR